jgi:hypothetical protein
MIGDHADPALLALSCMRCGAVREQPREQEPVWRGRQAQRGQGGKPPSFGDGH